MPQGQPKKGLRRALKNLNLRDESSDASSEESDVRKIVNEELGKPWTRKALIALRRKKEQLEEKKMQLDWDEENVDVAIALIEEEFRRKEEEESRPWKKIEEEEEEVEGKMSSKRKRSEEEVSLDGEGENDDEGEEEGEEEPTLEHGAASSANSQDPDDLERQLAQTTEQLRLAKLQQKWLRKQKEPLGYKKPRSNNYDDEDDEQEKEEAPDSPGGPPESGQAKYCEDCEMWLNGPTQWEDHKIGKKHKKNVKKGGANETSTATLATSKAQRAKEAKAKDAIDDEEDCSEDPMTMEDAMDEAIQGAMDEAWEMAANSKWTAQQAEGESEEKEDGKWYASSQEWYARKWLQQKGEAIGIPKRYTPCRFFFKAAKCQDPKCLFSHEQFAACLKNICWDWKQRKTFSSTCPVLGARPSRA